MPCIVQVVTTLELGGAQKICLATAKHFLNQGWPSFLVYGESGPLFNEAKQALGPHLIQAPLMQRNIDISRDITALVQLRKIFIKLQAQHGDLILHTHSSKAGIIGRIAIPSQLAQGVCHTVHGFSFPNFSPQRRWLPLALERLAGHRTDHTFFVSQSDQQLANRQRLFPRTQSHILRPGIDLPQLLKATHHLQANDLFLKMGFKKDDAIIVAVANAKPQKDPLFHVDILAGLHQHSDKYHLIFLGDGPLLGDMRRRAQQAGLATYLHTPGFVENVVPYLHMAEGFLLASKFEGLPCAVLEALAIGLPTFVRDNGWAQDLNEWAASLHPLSAETTADRFADAIHPILKERPERTPNLLPNEFTQTGMLKTLGDIYSSMTDSLP